MALELDLLNEAQRRAVTAPDGAHLVIAGAGTGKTSTLTHRVAWLIEQGVSPSAIVLLTFTRRAAHEMLERVSRMTGGARGVRGGTFHAFATRALRRHADRLGYTPAFTILDRSDAEGLVGMIRSELGLGGKGRRFATKGTILGVLSRAVNTSRTLEEVLESQYPQYAGDVADFEAIARRYAERKQQQGVVDFDDLLVLLDRLLSTHDEARRALSEASRHVLVDEYQDTNRLQARIAARLASVHGNLMVVGDEAQSIYAFRGADVENILQFPRLFDACAITTLEENYRSTQPILDLANGVLATAAQGYDKHLRSPRRGGARPVLWDLADEHAQADVVLGELLRLHEEEGLPFAEQAVLVRAAHHSALLEVLLAEAGIPFRKVGGLRFTEAAHVKDVFALLRLVANPRDVLAWFRVLGWFEGLGARTAQTLADRIADAPEPRLDPVPWQSKRFHADLVSLAELLVQLEARLHDLPDLLETAVAWYRERLPLIHEDWKRRVRDLEALGLLAERAGTLEALLADLALDPVEQAEVHPTGHDDLLTISTVHSAKGLEWDAVQVLQLSDGSFPSGFALDEPDELEEERRLLYVAVTRARRHLGLMVPRFVRQRRGPVLGPGCVLLESIDDLAQLVDVRRTAGGAYTLGVRGAPDAAERGRLARFRDVFGDG
ncbi:MAG: ATP-dependent helicase [Alphaproteobacteria bacterium]|nr:ATP-dependent helicase [Alphaproteobacteria bacterium]